MQKLLLSISLLFFCFQMIGQNLYDKDHSLLFAKFLYQSREFKLAAVEYERLVFMDSTDLLSQEYLIKSYRKQDNYTKGLKRANQLFPNNAQAPASIAREKALMLLFQREMSGLYELIAESNMIDNDKLLFSIGGNLLSSNYSQASELSRVIDQASGRDLMAIRYLSEEALRLKYKSPVTSTLLSAFVPGLGKAYTGNWKDALFSFLFTSVSAYQAYRGFNQKGISSWYGWGYAALGSGFYLGNLYGSYKAANKYNYRQRHELDHRVENIFYRLD